jgi:hypothetical protein
LVLKVSMMQFKSLIDMRPPYGALDGFELRRPGLVAARVAPEHPLGHEVGPLAAAEAGRHLAALGACACSSLQRDGAVQYFLAHQARLVRHRDRMPLHNSQFEAVAWAHPADDAHAPRSRGPRQRREMSAHAVLRESGSGAPLFELDISYRVLSQSVFQRVFAPHRRDLRGMPRDGSPVDAERLVARRSNPYRRPLPVEITRRTPESVRAKLRGVTADLCAGHYPLYPALPVATLMQSLSTLCGEVLRVRWGNETSYRVISADVSADRLAFAGERLLFEAAFREAAYGREHYQAWASLEDGTPVGWLALELEPVRCESSLAHATPAFI